MLKNNLMYIMSYKFITIASSLLLITKIVYSAEQYPYYDPQKGYGIESDGSPWFDGKDYPYFQEMYDGKSIKPQEEGSYQNFPEDNKGL